MAKLKFLKKTKYVMGLTPEEKNYLLPVLALYCLEKGKISNQEIDLLIQQTREEINKRS